MTYSNETLGGDDGLLQYAVIASFCCFLEKVNSVADHRKSVKKEEETMIELTGHTLTIEQLKEFCSIMKKYPFPKKAWRKFMIADVLLNKL